MDITNSAQAEQYLTQYIQHVEDMLFHDNTQRATSVLMQVSRESSGHTAWNFLLLPNGQLSGGSVSWLTNNGHIFITKPYGPTIEEWLTLAAKNNDFKTASMESFRYLNADPITRVEETNNSETEHPARSRGGDSTEHDCPVCHKLVVSSSRYPKEVCGDCRMRTTDSSGRGVKFVGHFSAYYSDDTAFYLDSSGAYEHACFIDTIPCYADEAYMGGIVVTAL